MTSYSDGKPTQLCEKCKEVDPRIPYEKLKSLEDWLDGKPGKSYTLRLSSRDIEFAWVDRYPDFPALRVSAEKGCSFCELLRHVLLDQYTDTAITKAESQLDESVQATSSTSHWDGRVEIYGGRFGTEQEDPIYNRTAMAVDGAEYQIQTVSFKVSPYPPWRQQKDEERGDSQRIRFRFYRHHGKPVFDLLMTPIAHCRVDAVLTKAVRRVLPCDDALAPTNVMAINDWLNVCLGSHKTCRSQHLHSLPSRVIDVGPTDGSRDPKLIITLGMRAFYVALSHCWGKPTESDPPNSRTTSANFEDVMEGCPMHTLPQNFQDAITTVRKLGFRYLWIDALCIIQDSTQDWEKEAAQMDAIYRSAGLTIAATSASSKSDGFLKRSRCSRPIMWVPPAANVSEGVCIRYQPDRATYSRQHAIESSAWNKRGWTFQERILSSRVLHFAQERLYWECRKVEGSEENEPERDKRYHTLWMNTDHRSVTLPAESRHEPWYERVSE
ncbi:MAG: hypothetical protein Q9169_008226 [Polycauliona sp. 2 TL-2023]